MKTWHVLAAMGVTALACAFSAPVARAQHSHDTPPVATGPAVAAAMRFDPNADATAAVDAALAAARDSGKHVLIIFGGDWCHDSMAIAEEFARPRTAAMLQQRYELVWVHVPFSRTERSIPVAHRFGLGDIVGTPTMLILTPAGHAINLDDAPTWRNAASRKRTAIYRHFERAVTPPAPATH